MEWYVAVLKKYADFSGRARRKEYWMYALITTLISIALAVVDNAAGLVKATGGISPLQTLYALGTLIPGIAVTVRRLQDIGKSGWMILIAFIPLIGAIILLLFMIREGDRGTNQYGRDPLGRRGRNRDDDDRRDGRRYEEYDDEGDDDRPRRRRDEDDEDDDRPRNRGEDRRRDRD